MCLCSDSLGCGLLASLKLKLDTYGSRWARVDDCLISCGLYIIFWNYNKLPKFYPLILKWIRASKKKKKKIKWMAKNLEIQWWLYPKSS